MSLARTLTAKAGRLDRREAVAFVQRQRNEKRAVAVQPFQVRIADSLDDSQRACRDSGAKVVIQPGDPSGRLTHHDKRKVFRQHPRLQRGAQGHGKVLPNIEAADAEQELSS